MSDLKSALDEAQRRLEIAREEEDEAEREETFQLAKTIGAELVAESEKIDQALRTITAALDRRKTLHSQLCATGCVPSIEVSSRFNCAVRLNVAVRAAGTQRMFIGHSFGSATNCNPLAVEDAKTAQLLVPPKKRDGKRAA